MFSIRIFLCIFNILVLTTIVCGKRAPVYETEIQNDKVDSPCSRKCPKGCECENEKAVCTDIDEIPNCFPDDEIEELTILDSPNLDLIDENAFDKYDEDLETVIIRRTGVKNVKWEAFSEIKNLKVLEITESKITEIETMELNRLKSLNLSCNVGLDFQENQRPFLDMPNLKTLDLSNCNIQNLGVNTFEGLNELTYLNMDSNTKLESIPRYALYNMSKLQEIHISGCGLSTLYPEHFQKPFEYGNLVNVTAIINLWKCETMCEYVQWMEDNDNFRSIFYGGFCDTPSYLNRQTIRYLSEDDVCYTYTSAAIIVMGALGIMVLLLLCCFFLAFQNCFIGMCRSSDSATQSRTSRSQVAAMTNRAAELDDVSVVTVDGAMSVGSIEGWCIDDIDPPCYNAVISKDHKNVSTTQNTDVDSMAGIPPPPYDEHAEL